MIYNKYIGLLYDFFNQPVLPPFLYRVSLPHIITCAIFAIGFTVYWMEFLKVPTLAPWLRRKPFNCQSCLPFWITLIVLPFPTITLSILSGAFLTGIITPLVIKWLRN